MKDRKARCSTSNSKEIRGKKISFTEIFVIIKASIINNTYLGGKKFNLDCKDFNMESYSCDT